MQFETQTHLCAVVERSGPLQKFVQQEFQEQLGFSAQQRHTASSAKARAVRAFSLGHILLNGQRCDRLQNVCAGDEVMVHKAMLATDGVCIEANHGEVQALLASQAVLIAHYKELPGFLEAAAYLQRPQPLSLRVDGGPATETALAAGDMHLVDWPVPAAVLTDMQKRPAALIRSMELTGEVCQQGLESMLPVRALEVAPGQAVLNICAVNLAKTTQILNNLAGDGLLVATDTSEIRTLRNFKKCAALGGRCTPLVSVVGEPAALHFDRLFDRVLCNVKCTGEGTLRRSAPSLWGSASAEKLVGSQLQALRAGLALLKPGGRLVYSTCSFNPMENENVVREVLAEGGVHLVRFDWAGRFQPGLGAGLEACVRVLPSMDAPHVGGAFFAIFQRLAEPGCLRGDSACSNRAVCVETISLCREAGTMEVCDLFGLDPATPLVRQELLVYLATGQVSVEGGVVLGRGLPLFRAGADGDGGLSWQVCNEGAAEVAERATRRKVVMEPEAFRRLLRCRVQACAAMSEGPAVVVCEELALAARVSTAQGLEVLAPQALLERFSARLGLASTGGGSEVPSLDAFTLVSPGAPGQDLCEEGNDMLVVNGLRYRVPFERWDTALLPTEAVGLPLLQALARFVRDPQSHDLLDEGWWQHACARGHVKIRGRFRWPGTLSAAGVGQTDELASCLLARSHICLYTDFEPVKGDEVVDRGNFHVRHLVHVHERCVRAELPKVILGTDRFLVVDKPAGLPSQTNQDGGALNVAGVLASMGYGCLYAAHRLDQPVSGVLVLGRSSKQQRSFLDAGVEQQKQKTYLARVRPALPNEHMVCSLPLGWDGQKCVPDEREGKAAVTEVRSLTPPLRDGTQLVECTPFQGRRHQIRAHLEQLGSPIANDQTYGGDPVLEEGGVLQGFLDDEAGTLAAAFASAARGYCPSCAWAGRALRGLEVRPKVRGGIWLHAWRYRVPPLGIDAEAPPPRWALAALEGAAG